MIPVIFALVTIIGGSNAVVVKFTVNQFPTVIFVALRSIVAIAVVSPLILKTSKLKLDKIMPSLLFVNLLFAANWLTFASGVQKTTVTISQLIYVPTSIIVAIFGFLLFKEKLSKSQIIGLVLTIAGSLILILGSISGEPLTFGTPIGNLLVTLGMFCWAAYLVFSGRISKVYSPLTITFYNFVASFILASTLYLINSRSQNFSLVNVDKNGLLGILFVGIVSSATYFYLNQWLIKHTSAFISSLQLYPITVIASSLGVILYGDKLTLNLISAAILIMIGVFIATSNNYLKDKLKLWI